MQTVLRIALLLPLTAPVAQTASDELALLRGHHAPALADLRGGGLGARHLLADDEREQLAIAANQSPELAELRGGEHGTGGLVLVTLLVVALLIVLF